MQVIEEMTKRMADGMAEFLEREVVTIADYDRYCYFVAGIVGIGLSRVIPFDLHKSIRFQQDV
jgi:farnesyl-diphosphate farnesyltransferase